MCVFTLARILRFSVWQDFLETFGYGVNLMGSTNEIPALSALNAREQLYVLFYERESCLSSLFTLITQRIAFDNNPSHLLVNVSVIKCFFSPSVFQVLHTAFELIGLLEIMKEFFRVFLL